jgi:hypothetical protein
MAASLYSLGKKLYTDETFASGTNSLNVYDNNGTGTVSITRISSAGLNAPNNSGFVVQITHTGSAQTPGYGGFYFAAMTRANATLACVFKAKLPSGYTINYHSNAIGSGGNTYWVTDNVGTGKWEDYVYVVRCGDSGTFSSTHFYAITGSPAPSAGAPLTWYLASATVYDIDDRTAGTQGVQGVQGTQGLSNQGVQGISGSTGDFSGVFNNDVWYKTADAKNRFYFSQNGRTYFGSQNGYEWRSAADTNIMDISNSGALTINGTTDQTIIAEQSGTNNNWRGRILSKNSSADKASFLGVYASAPGVFAHNYTLNAWNTLYVNTTNGSDGGNVILAGSGSVAIGYASPSYKLDVFGSGHFSGNLTVDGTINATITGTADSANLLNALGNYVWNVASLPNTYPLGITNSFVGPEVGQGSWQNYGSLLNMRTYSGGGGSLQLYVPYSPTYGGDTLKVRFGNYDVSSGNSWTSWKDIITSEKITLNNLASPINPDNVTQNQLGYCTNVSLFSQGDGGLYSSAYSSSWIHQIFGDFRTGQIAIRGKSNGTWGAWRTVIDSSNIGSYGTNVGNLTGGNITGDYQVTEAIGIRFGATNQTDTNDGFISAGRFGSGLNIIGTQTTAGTGRQVRVWGSLINDSGTSYVLSDGGTWNIKISSPDGDRNAGTKLPTTSPRAVRFDFASASTTGTGGNYAGVMTYAPWTGTTASTGDASYQLAFGSTLTNGSGIPQLNIRNGIDSTWNSWYTIIHSGNIGNYSTSTNVTVNQQSYNCTNPITTSGATITIGQASNAYGRKFVSPTEPTSVCDGDIWFDTSGNTNFTAVLGPLANVGSASQVIYKSVDGLNIAEGSSGLIFSGGANGNLSVGGNITAYYSDERLKENVKPILSALSKLLSLRGVTYNGNEVAEKYGYLDKNEQVGVIAQDVEKVLPQVVVPAPFDTAYDKKGNKYSKSGENYKTVQYDKIVPLLIEAIKEQQETIINLQNRIQNLENN